MSLAAWQRGWMPTSKCCWVSSLSSLQEESATVTSGGQAGGATTREWCGVNAQMVSMSQVRSYAAFSPFWNRLWTSTHKNIHTHKVLHWVIHITQWRQHKVPQFEFFLPFKWFHWAWAAKTYIFFFLSYIFFSLTYPVILVLQFWFVGIAMT